MEYKLLKGVCLSILETNVNHFLLQGWVPAGGVVTFTAMERGGQTRYFAQALTRSLTDKKEHTPEEPCEIYDALRQRRSEIANEKNIPPYCVAHNSVLREIAVQKPITLEELATIKGLGPAKLSQYGERFLEIIRTHLNSHRRNSVTIKL